MMRSYIGSSRSYPGRPAQQAVSSRAALLMATLKGDWAGVSRGHSR
jgi:hypothetical protein